MGNCFSSGKAKESLDGVQRMAYALKENRSLNEGGFGLLIVDPQNCFHPGGSLAIPTADEDAERIAKFIRDHGNEISEIYTTLDTHSKLAIFHPLFWCNTKGEHPQPLTTISSKDLKMNVWQPSRPEKEVREWCEFYIGELERLGRFQLTIWPEHALLGTPGHNVREVIADALSDWEESQKKAVHYVIKGTNAWTEHYSALRAEVERTDDPGTKMNTKLIQDLQRHAKVFITGQAASHCVNWSTRDLCKQWNAAELSRIVILQDCMSSVPGFENAGEEFIKDMRNRGLTISTTAEAL